jgi:hypothetical protein
MFQNSPNPVCPPHWSPDKRISTRRGGDLALSGDIRVGMRSNESLATGSGDITRCLNGHGSELLTNLGLKMGGKGKGEAAAERSVFRVSADIDAFAERESKTSRVRSISENENPNIMSESVIPGPEATTNKSAGAGRWGLGPVNTPFC